MPRTTISTSPSRASIISPKVFMVQFPGPRRFRDSQPSSLPRVAANWDCVRPSAFRRAHSLCTASKASILIRSTPKDARCSAVKGQISYRELIIILRHVVRYPIAVIRLSIKQLIPTIHTVDLSINPFLRISFPEQLSSFRMTGNNGIWFSEDEKNPHLRSWLNHKHFPHLRIRRKQWLYKSGLPIWISPNSPTGCPMLKDAKNSSLHI